MPANLKSGLTYAAWSISTADISFEIATLINKIIVNMYFFILHVGMICMEESFNGK